jgi:DNA-binding MurR/RpiR family transcriptional regulator
MTQGITDLSSDVTRVGPHLRMMLPNLTRMESRVVELMLQGQDFSGSTPLRALAEAAGVSDAMVVKIAKKLGFAGFREMRDLVGRYNQLPIGGLYSEIGPDDASDSILSKIFRTAIQALEETLAIIDIEAFERAAIVFAGARNRDIYGLGGSAQIARDVAHKFLRIGMRCNVFDDTHMMLMSAALLGPEDVAIAISHSGQTNAVIDALTLARRSGARTIVVTSYANAPLAREADLVLSATARGSPLLGENAAARIAQLSILDALFMAVAQRDYAGAEQRLKKTMNAVIGKRG